MEGIKETIENTCRWTQGWLEENSARLDAIGLACVLMSLSKLADSAQEDKAAEPQGTEAPKSGRYVECQYAICANPFRQYAYTGCSEKRKGKEAAGDVCD